MTGIERLSEVVRELGRFSFCYDLYETLGNIADQIEREQDAMVADSPYDALPPDERDAIAWVREHGGLDEVEAHWSGRVSLTSVKRMVTLHKSKRERLKAHAMGLERKCAERRERIRELERERDDLRTRVMPEGMEWLVEAWPRFEDGGPVRFSDDFERYGEESVVSAVTMYADGSFALNFRAYSKGEHVKRPDFHNSTKVNARLTSHSPAPAPNVLDADGAEIRVGDTVWTTRDLDKFTVTNPNNGNFLSVSCKGEDGEDYCCYPTDLTHSSPVLAADGRPLREGEAVWYRDHIDPLEVRGISTTESGAQYVKAYNDYEGEVSAPARCFSHKRHDSWERLEEDAGKDPCDYFGFDGDETCGKCPASAKNCEQTMARDLVRRAKALAGGA